MPDSFANLLGDLVRRSGMTMAQVARKTHLNPSVLSRLRTGTRAPTGDQVRILAKLLRPVGADLARFHELAALAHSPAVVRARLAAMERAVELAQQRSGELEREVGDRRRADDYHDGWWLAYCRAFRNDGRIQRSLLRVDGDKASVLVMDHGSPLYSYHGSFESLGDKLFIRAGEDRGGMEWLQIILHSLFDFREPTVLYGVITGISGRDLKNPSSFPTAARILLLYAGDLSLPASTVNALRGSLGGFSDKALGAVWPSFLGDDAHLHAALRTVDEDLGTAVRRLIDNQLGAAEQVLRAELR